jgi:hypothetical protein
LQNSLTKAPNQHQEMRMPLKKYSNDEIDMWWDKYLAIHTEDNTIRNTVDFNVFKLKFGFIFCKEQYIPERVHKIMTTSLREFCTLPSEGIYPGEYIDAFGFSCRIQDFATAKMAYDLIEDKDLLEESEVPKKHIKWFDKQTRLANAEGVPKVKAKRQPKEIRLCYTCRYYNVRPTATVFTPCSCCMKNSCWEKPLPQAT